MQTTKENPCKVCNTILRYPNNKCIECSRAAVQRYKSSQKGKLANQRAEQSHNRKIYKHLYTQNLAYKAYQEAWKNSSIGVTYKKSYFKSAKYKADRKIRRQSIGYKTKEKLYEQTAKRKSSRSVFSQNNRAKRRAAEGSYTVQEWLFLKEQYQLRCLCCRKHEVQIRILTPDHVIPIAAGGTNWIDNIQPLCMSCNQKNWSHYLEFGFQIDYRYMD